MGTKVTRLLLDGEVHEVLPERRDVSRTKWKIAKGRVAGSQEFRESTRFEVTVVKAMGLRSLVLWVPAPKVEKKHRNTRSISTTSQTSQHHSKRQEDEKQKKTSSPNKSLKKQNQTLKKQNQTHNDQKDKGKTDP
jgi:hypothetical protein